MAEGCAVGRLEVLQAMYPQAVAEVGGADVILAENGAVALGGSQYLRFRSATLLTSNEEAQRQLFKEVLCILVIHDGEVFGLGVA